MRATRARCDHTRTSASSCAHRAVDLRPCARALSSVVDPPSAPSPPARTPISRRTPRPAQKLRREKLTRPGSCGTRLIPPSS
eukprot:4955580-Prymnesium_polylepis.1